MAGLGAAKTLPTSLVCPICHSRIQDRLGRGLDQILSSHQLSLFCCLLGETEVQGGTSPQLTSGTTLGSLGKYLAFLILGCWPHKMSYLSVLFTWGGKGN
jgi:hypothetical protein